MKLTQEEQRLYNALLDINWSEPYIQLHDISGHTGLTKAALEPMLEALALNNKLLMGTESTDRGYMTTYTPKVARGEALGFPSDFYKHEEWQEFKIC